jgi:predicted nucleotidyltransferase
MTEPEVRVSDRPNVSYGDRQVCLANEILRTVVGSGVHGIAISGFDDRDEMGIFIEPRSAVYGTDRPMDHHIWRTQPEGARSGPGDTDYAGYSLRKYLRLAAKGNPTALLPLFAPEPDVLVTTKIGQSLRGIRNVFLSQESVHRFLGYMHAQHERMLGGGKRNRVPNRPELTEKYGWDVKYGAHALRLSFQGREIAETGTLTLPMPKDTRDVVLSVKRGEISRDDVDGMIRANTTLIRRSLERSQLPEQPHWPTINVWSIQAHEQHWHAGRRA